MDEKEKKQRTVKLSIIASIILSIVFIFVILYFTVKPSDLEKLSQITIRYEFFIGATFLNFLSWCLWGLRLKIFSSAADENIKISWWKSTRIVMANLFLAGITPSMAGGEPVRIHLLNKNGMSFGSSTACVLGERLIDAIFLLICVPLAFFIFRNHLEEYAVQQGTNITAISIAFLLRSSAYFLH